MQCKSQLHIKLTGFLPRRDFWIPQSVQTYFWGKDYAWISLPYFWAWVLEERCTWHELQPFWWYGDLWLFWTSLNKFEQVWSKAKERSQKQAYWLQSTIRDQLLARLATSCCLELFGRQGALLSALASLVLLQPPVLTSTDVFLRLRYIAAHGDCSTIFSQRLSK